MGKQPSLNTSELNCIFDYGNKYNIQGQREYERQIGLLLFAFSIKREIIGCMARRSHALVGKRTLQKS